MADLSLYDHGHQVFQTMLNGAFFGFVFSHIACAKLVDLSTTCVSISQENWRLSRGVLLVFQGSDCKTRSDCQIPESCLYDLEPSLHYPVISGLTVLNFDDRTRTDLVSFYSEVHPIKYRVGDMSWSVAE